jgi:hypothetical protein
VVYPVPTNEAMTTETQRYNCFIRNRGNDILKHARPDAKSSNPTNGLPVLEILTTGKSHKKKPRGLYPRGDSEMKKVLRFKYAMWNIKRLREMKESDKTINENNIKISIITVSEKEITRY